MNEILNFEGDGRDVEVRLEAEALWVTQSQMAESFATTIDNIGLHLKSIFEDNKFQREAQLPRNSR